MSASSEHLNQTCIRWVKMIDVYRVIFHYEMTKGSVAMQRPPILSDDQLSSDLRPITVPSVGS